MSFEEQAEALTNAKQSLRTLAYRVGTVAATEENIDEAADSAVRWITHFMALTLVDGEMLPTRDETSG